MREACGNCVNCIERICEDGRHYTCEIVECGDDGSKLTAFRFWIGKHSVCPSFRPLEKEEPC